MPCWKTSTISPNVALTESVFIDRLDRHQHRAERDREHHPGTRQDQHNQQREPIQQQILQIQRRRGVTPDQNLGILELLGRVPGQFRPRRERPSPR